MFQRAYRLSLEIHQASLDFPRIEQFALGRSGAPGIEVDLRQSCRRFGRQSISKPEFRRFVTMALGSADEMQVWTLYCRDLGYVDADTAERWRGAYREVARMLTALYRGSSDL